MPAVVSRPARRTGWLHGLLGLTKAPGGEGGGAKG